jgi:hypothetical protein
MKAIFSRYATTIALVQVSTTALAGACSIWYGGWYPDAQSKLHDNWKIQNPKAEKPNFWQTSYSDISWTSPVGYTFFLIIAASVSGLGVVINAGRLADLEQQEKNFKREEEDHSDTRKYYYSSLKNSLIQLFTHEITKFDDTCRVSVYRYDSVLRAFVMVFRHSRIQRYERKGRVKLPENEGILGATYHNGDHLYVCKLPKKESKNYGKEINKQLAVLGASIAEDTLKKLNMPSRCYLGYSIRDIHSKEKFAVLIFESTNDDHFKKDEICAILDAKIIEIEAQVRHISRIDAKLNPYGLTP